MELYIYNNELSLIGIVDTFKSLTWNRKYNEVGEFNISILATDKNLKLFTKGNILCKQEDAEAGYIETREIKLIKTGEEVITINGRLLPGYLGRRVIWNTIEFSGTYEELMRKIIDENCINPKISDRKIPLLELDEINNFDDGVTIQTSYDNVLDKITALAKASGLGFKAKIDEKNKKIIFKIYKGSDRSVKQTILPRVVFSRSLENVTELKYTDSINNYSNVALIKGVGEGDARITKIIGNSNVGLERYELYVDAKDISNSEVSNSEYLNLLQERGEEKLAETKEVQTLDGTIDSSSYRKKWDLGDIVTIYDDRWNVMLNTRITEVEEVYENGLVTIKPTFGDSVPTLITKIKQIINRR